MARLSENGPEQELCHKEDSHRERAKCLSKKMLPWAIVEKHIADSRANQKQLFHVVGTQEGRAGSRSRRGHCRAGEWLEKVEEKRLMRRTLESGVEYGEWQKLAEPFPFLRRVKSAAWFG